MTFVRRTLLVLAIVAASLPGARAATDAPSEVTGGLSWSSTDSVKTIIADFRLTFPVNDLLSFGPLLNYTSVRSEDDAVTADFDATSLGGLVELNTAATHNGIYFGLGATTLMGNDTDGWLLIPEVGFKFGTGTTLLRVAYSHPYQYGADDTEGYVDLQQSRVTVALGWRF